MNDFAEDYVADLNDMAADAREEYDAFLDAAGEDMSFFDDEPEFNDSMNGDFDSGMASAGFGTDEDYGGYDYSDFAGDCEY